MILSVSLAEGMKAASPSAELAAVAVNYCAGSLRGSLLDADV